MTAPYLAGYDAGKNGPNEMNSNAKWFFTKESKDEWERGRAAGQRGDKIQPVPSSETQDVLTQPEVKATVLALQQLLEDLQGSANNQNIPWNAESRATLNEMIFFTESAAKKMMRLADLGKDLSLKKYEYDPNIERDQFFTKES